MNKQEFTAKYGCTLHKDPNTKENYIKLLIDDFNELGYMQQALINGLLLLTELEKSQYSNVQMQSVTYWICKILLSIHPQDELEGLSEWLESD